MDLKKCPHVAKDKTLGLLSLIPLHFFYLIDVRCLTEYFFLSIFNDFSMIFYLLGSEWFQFTYLTLEEYFFINRKSISYPQTGTNGDYLICLTI